MATATTSASTFQDLGVHRDILRGIHASGYEFPTRVQAQTIMLVAQNQQDVLVQAQSGSGKTAAFAIAALHLCSMAVAPTKAGPTVIVLASTRELAEQTASEFTRLAKFMPSIRVAVCCGGTPFSRDADILRPRQRFVSSGTGRRDWRRRRTKTTTATLLPRIVVGTLGRIYRLITRAIWERLPQESCRIGLFSATMTRDTVRVAEEILRRRRAPLLLRANDDGSGLIPPAIALRYVNLGGGGGSGDGYHWEGVHAHKEDVVCDLLEKVKDCGAAVVFVNTKAKGFGKAKATYAI